MAQDDRFDLARLERLERRLQAAAIRNLKARYAALCDAQYDPDGTRLGIFHWLHSRASASSGRAMVLAAAGAV
jgi:hypothetical protein